ncbi:MAG: HAMP domain-containing histidine kinase [Planctomycetes bacterium]|nr:HAMP domain-containing histidine kinase [Planctomycetota bacterium]
MARLSSRGIGAGAAAEQEARRARLRLNLRWLLKLRWAAVVGQLVTIAGVAVFVGVGLPLFWLLGFISLTAITNGLLQRRYRGVVRDSGEEGEILPDERLLAVVMAGDVLTFTALLHVSGGTSNPFSIFYLVHVVLAAIVLRPRFAWAVGFQSVLCFALLFIDHLPLPILEGPNASSGIRQWGLLVSFSGVALIIAWFVVRITEDLAVRETDLLQARQEKARHDRIEALVTLAAGAAHELSTPLATIAIAASELQHDLERRHEAGGGLREALEDLDLIKSQLKRCREILEQMSADSGEVSGEHLLSTELGQLLQWVIEALPHQDRIRLRCAGGVARRSMVLPRRALTRALRAFVKNALDASESHQLVTVTLSGDEEGFDLEVVDEGQGMSEDVLARVFDPFYTTKSAGRGMGLGLYLSRSVIERLGGSIEIESEPGRGTTVQVRIPYSGPEHDAAVEVYAAVTDPAAVVRAMETRRHE